jgi:hypothetical protein
MAKTVSAFCYLPEDKKAFLREEGGTHLRDGRSPRNLNTGYTSL